MKSIYSLISMILLFSILTGCDKESEGWSTTITNYVTFSFEMAEGTDQLGNQKIIIEKGDSYDVNSNFTATEGETDVQDKVEIAGSVDGNTPGYYVVDYSAVNADGYSAAESIGVFVSDPEVTTDISGSYSGDVYRTPTGGSYTGAPVTISKVADGIFYLNRMLGSYYYDGVGYFIYGNYFVHGFIRLNADNTITHLASFSPAWQNTLIGEGIVDGVYNPATGVITFGAKYVNNTLIFNVTLTPNE